MVSASYVQKHSAISRSTRQHIKVMSDVDLQHYYQDAEMLSNTYVDPIGGVYADKLMSVIEKELNHRAIRIPDLNEKIEEMV